MQKITHYAKLVAQGIIFGLCSALIFLGAQSFFSDTGAVQRMWSEFTFNNSVQSAFSYKKRNEDYIGVCADSGFADSVRCVENGKAFKLQKAHPVSGYYCADSTGFNAVVSYYDGEGYACKVN